MEVYYYRVTAEDGELISEGVVDHIDDHIIEDLIPDISTTSDRCLWDVQKFLDTNYPDLKYTFQYQPHHLNWYGMQISKTQIAKQLYETLRKEEKIDIMFGGVYEDIWVSSKRKAYYIKDLGLSHLANILEQDRRSGRKHSKLILEAYEAKKEAYEASRQN